MLLEGLALKAVYGKEAAGKLGGSAALLLCRLVLAKQTSSTALYKISSQLMDPPLRVQKPPNPMISQLQFCHPILIFCLMLVPS